MKSNQVNKIGIILKPSKFEDLGNLITNLVRWLKKRNKEVIFLESERQRIEKKVSERINTNIQYMSDKSFYKELDLVVSLGGDGTLLGVCRNIKSNTPVLGVNLGRLGFITEFSKKEFYEQLNSIFVGKFSVFKKSLYSVEVQRKDKTITKEFFFNDVVFSKNEIARMFTLSIEAEDQHIYNLTGDGLIISSTYGSTAYSLAAGGPIVHPDVSALILTPICAHSLTHRPMVIPDKQIIQVSLLDKINSVTMTLDGQHAISIEATDIIRIKKSPSKSVHLIQNLDRTYYHTLKEKFVHGRKTI